MGCRYGEVAYNFSWCTAGGSGTAILRWKMTSETEGCVTNSHSTRPVFIPFQQVFFKHVNIQASAANRLLIKICTQNNKSENAVVPLRSTRSSVPDDTAGWSQLGSAVGRPEQLWRLLTEFCLCQGVLSSQTVGNGLFVIRPLCLKQEIK